MKAIKTIGFASLALVLLVVFSSSQAQCDAWNKKTILTISEPLMIPGATLTPGKYVMKLMDSPSNRHIVQVFNEDESHLVTTILAIPNSRLRATGKSQFGFWEMPQGSPSALRAWFYPGDNFGQEFAYPKDTAAQIAANTKEEVPLLTDEDQARLSSPEPAVETPAQEQPTEAKAEPVVEQAPKEEPAPVALAQAPAPPVERAPDPVREIHPFDTATAPPTTAQLPATASPLPLLGIFGMASIGIGAILRGLRKSS